MFFISKILFFIILIDYVKTEFDYRIRVSLVELSLLLAN